jgi:hypothetical protein
MEEFLVSCVSKYQLLAGERGGKLRHVETPYLDETTLDDLDDELVGTNKGFLQPIASSILMKVL